MAFQNHQLDGALEFISHQDYGNFKTTGGGEQLL
jgi:hypothetical protein